MVAFAIAMIAATSASASLPEWGGCEPAATGHGRYSDPGCTVKVTGAAKKTEGDYEWYTGAAFGFVYELEHFKNPEGRQLHHEKLGLLPNEGVNVGPSTFETPAHKKMECASGSIYFRLENANTKAVERVLLNLTGCQSEGHECESNLSGFGHVSNENFWSESEALKGTIGFVSGKGTEHPVVGLSLTAFDTKGENAETKRLLFASCSGGIGPLWIGGNPKGGNAVISLLSPVNEMVGEGKEHTAFTQSFVQTGGIQEPTVFEGRKPGGLMGNLENHWEPLGVGASVNLEPEGLAPPIEIKATP
jgi:hypothetical protein